MIIYYKNLSEEGKQKNCCSKSKSEKKVRDLQINTIQHRYSRQTMSRALGVAIHKLMVKSRPVILKEDKSILGKMNKFLNLGYFYNFLKAVEMRALMGALISLKHVDSESLVGKIDVVLSTLVPVLFLCIELLVFIAFVNQSEKKNPIYSKIKEEEKVKKEKKINYLKAGGILIDYKTDLRLGPADILIRNVNDLAFPLVLVFWTSNPILQLAILTILTMIALISAIFLRPFQTFHLNFLDIFNKVFYLIILGILGFSEYRGDSLTNKERFKTIGVAVIATIFLMLAVNFLTVVIVGAKRLFCKEKEKGNPQPEIRKEPKNFSMHVKKEILNDFSDQASQSQASSLDHDHIY